MPFFFREQGNGKNSSTSGGIFLMSKNMDVQKYGRPENFRDPYLVDQRTETQNLEVAFIKF